MAETMVLPIKASLRVRLTCRRCGREFGRTFKAAGTITRTNDEAGRQKEAAARADLLADCQGQALRAKTNGAHCDECAKGKK